jgi:UDP-GlcNAc:undecaprenyl-phosphate/decaprenyl-phosphate GlcNAc-1-phosphate transferase
VGRPVALVPLGAALAIGVCDDRFGLPPVVRLVGQLALGGLIAALQPIHLSGWMGIPLIVVAAVLLINGFNLLDGLDMLAGGVGAACAAGFAVLVHGSGRLLASSLTGALVAFLWYNRPPSRIYLGDGGSYLLGASMTVLLTHAWGVGVSSASGLLALLLLVVPATEVACAIVRRRRSGHPLMSGDRSHPYDLLVSRGWSRIEAAGAYIAVETGALVIVVLAVLCHASVLAALLLDVVVTVTVVSAAILAGGFNGPAEVAS